MVLKFTNTLSGELEEFTPKNPLQVRMYVCGPTVYNYAHIGNARPAVIFDVLYRLLKEEYKSVLYARNYTDVDDKINAKASADGVSIELLTNKYIDAYRADTMALGVLAPDFEPRVTDNIVPIKQMIFQLVEQGFAYVVDGHVLFEVEKYRDYGNLAGRNVEDMIAGARIEVAPYKRNPADFVLWKPSRDNEPGWQADWGYGRPGWHIECSAMINDLFGDYVDIHGGGADLIFPHHENEIAQSTCYNHGRSFCAHWMHNGHLTVEGRKMSKSLGNVILIKDLLVKYSGEAVRYALLAAHYRQPLDWSEKSLMSASKSLKRLYRVWDSVAHIESEASNQIPNRVKKALANDLNTSDALASMHDIAREIRAEKSSEKLSSLKSELEVGGELLGLFQGINEEAEVVEDNRELVELIELKIKQRENARRNRDFETADNIRDELLREGISLKDGTNGTEWFKNEP